jgi:hypothetical protein
VSHLTEVKNEILNLQIEEINLIAKKKILLEKVKKDCKHLEVVVAPLSELAGSGHIHEDDDPGNLYICTNCGEVHWARSNYPGDKKASQRKFLHLHFFQAEELNLDEIEDSFLLSNDIILKIREFDKDNEKHTRKCYEERMKNGGMGTGM